MTTKGGPTEINMNDIMILDKSIETLMECKPLPETEVKALCDRVSDIPCLILLLDCFLIMVSLNSCYRQRKS